MCRHARGASCQCRRVSLSQDEIAMVHNKNKHKNNETKNPFSTWMPTNGIWRMGNELYPHALCGWV